MADNGDNIIDVDAQNNNEQAANNNNIADQQKLPFDCKDVCVLIQGVVYCGLCHYNSLVLHLNSREVPKPLLPTGNGVWTAEASSNIKRHFVGHHVDELRGAGDDGKRKLADWKKNVQDINNRCESMKKVDGAKAKVQLTLAQAQKRVDARIIQIVPPSNGAKAISVELEDETEGIIFLILSQALAFQIVEDRSFRKFFTYMTGHDFPVGIHNRHAVPEKCQNFCDKLRQAMLPCFKNKKVTGVIDKGRVWNDYIPFIIVDSETGSSLLWKLIHVSTLKDVHGNLVGDISDCRATSVAAACIQIATDLKANGIDLIAMVTDNAANMLKTQAIMKKELSIFMVQCFCHGMQLFVNDVTSRIPGWQPLMKKLSALRSQFMSKRASGSRRPLREANTTRWNSSLHLLSDVLDHYDILKQEVVFDEDLLVKPEEIEFLARMRVLLEPVELATKICEGDTSTLFDAVIALQLLFEIQPPARDAYDPDPALAIDRNIFESALVHRAESGFLLSDQLAALIYFCPIFNRSCLKGILDADKTDAKIAIRNILISETTRKHLRKETTQAQVGEEFDKWFANCKMYIAGAMKTEDRQNFTIEKYLHHINTDLKKDYPLIAEILLLFGSILASEAAAERVFSIMGIIIDDQRVRMNPENAFAVTQAKLILNNCTSSADLVKKFAPNEASNEQRREMELALGVDAAPSVKNARASIKLTHEMCLQMVYVLLERIRRLADTHVICALCLIQKKTISKASDCVKKNNCVQCCTCNFWYGCQCHKEGFDDDEAPGAGVGDFVCGYCKMHKSVEEVLQEAGVNVKEVFAKAGARRHREE